MTFQSSVMYFTTRVTHNKQQVPSIISLACFNPVVPLGILCWILSWLLKFDALLDTSTNTGHLSAVSRLLPTNLTDLVNMKNGLSVAINSGLPSKNLEKEIHVRRFSSACGIQTWPFLRILARRNFSLCLTLGLRSIFFLFGVSPLFLAICEISIRT